MIQFLKDHQNTATASTFKTKMFWAMETGSPATSHHIMCSSHICKHNASDSKGCCLSPQLSISVWHLKDILNLFLSWENAAHLFSMMAKLANAILFLNVFIFKLVYSTIEPADPRATLHKT